MKLAFRVPTRIRIYTTEFYYLRAADLEFIGVCNVSVILFGKIFPSDPMSRCESQYPTNEN